MDAQLPAPTIQLDWPAPLMTAAEVAAVLRITSRSVRDHIRRGNLRAIRLDGAGPYRIHADDAQGWADALLVTPDRSALAVDRYLDRRSLSADGASSSRRRRGRRVEVTP